MHSNLAHTQAVFNTLCSTKLLDEDGIGRGVLVTVSFLFIAAG